MGHPPSLGLLLPLRCHGSAPFSTALLSCSPCRTASPAQDESHPPGAPCRAAWCPPVLVRRVRRTRATACQTLWGSVPSKPVPCAIAFSAVGIQAPTYCSLFRIMSNYSFEQAVADDNL